MENMIEYWPYLLAASGAALLAVVIHRAIVRRRLRLERDFDRKLGTLLLPKETVKIVCDNPGGRWVLTSHRLIRDTKEGFLAFPFSKVKHLKGQDPGGKATAAPAKMALLTFQVGKTGYTIHNTSPDFVPLVRQLKAHTKPKKPPAKKAK